MGKKTFKVVFAYEYTIKAKNAEIAEEEARKVFVEDIPNDNGLFSANTTQIES